MSSLEKIALVTGASRGIGKAVAESLAQNNIKVVGSATTSKGAEAITDYLKPYGGFGVEIDVTKNDSIENALSKIVAELGSPNILVNNAGITADNLFIRMTEEEWHKVIDTNLSGVFRLTKACVRSMLKARWGRIVNISSIVAFLGNLGQSNYTAAKAGIVAFSKSLAREVAVRGITVNTIAPGFIDTDMTKELAEEQRAKLLEQIPVGRIGLPQDIAHAVNFLISNAAGYITGETIHVNGGMLMD